ncbi:MAG: rhomboid family intramembrane serine protease [Chthoniobacterales bacterium]
MVLTTLLLASEHAAWANFFVYNSTAVAHGQIWRFMTYAFASTPSLWFALEMIMLYYFGRIVERGIGSKAFAFLYAGLILWGSIICQLASLSGFPKINSGAQTINFAIFAAFIAMHPNAQFVFGLAGRWMFLALSALASLQLIAGHEFLEAVIFLTSIVGTLVFMKYNGYEEFFWGLPRFSFSKIFRRTSAPTVPKPPSGVVPKATPKNSAATSSLLLGSLSTTTSFIPVLQQPSNLTEEPRVRKSEAINIDGLLEKIGRTGMASLSDLEKEELEKARKALLERDKGTAMQCRNE